MNEKKPGFIFKWVLSLAVLLVFAAACWFGWRRLISGQQLLEAVKSSGTAKAVALVRWGARVDARDRINCTPLHYAQDALVADLLIQAGADPNAQNDDGFTPLHYAPSKSDVTLAEALLRGGGRLDIRDKDGQIPLNYAVNLGEKEIEDLFRSKSK